MNRLTDQRAGYTTTNGSQAEPPTLEEFEAEKRKFQAECTAQWAEAASEAMLQPLEQEFEKWALLLAEAKLRIRQLEETNQKLAGKLGQALSENHRLRNEWQKKLGFMQLDLDAANSAVKELSTCLDHTIEANEQIFERLTEERDDARTWAGLWKAVAWRLRGDILSEESEAEHGNQAN